MLQAGAPAALVILTTWIVNLRHYLMAASLAPRFRHLSRRTLLLLAHGVSDESYALAQARFARHPASAGYFLGCAVTVYLAWYGGAVGGVLLGSRIPDPRRFGLDFVFPAVFLAILAREIRAPWQWAVAGTSALIALAVAWGLGGTWHIAVAGLSASLLGVRLAPAGPPLPTRGRGGDRS
jgi:predicted branched-subunit amino acid permease